MFSNLSSWVSFFSCLAWFGAGLVIVGVVLESAGLLLKWVKKKSFRRWLGEVFGKEKKRRLLAWYKCIHPRLLHFETLGFLLLFIGLAIELGGSFTAEIGQSKENADLEATNQLISLQVEQLRSNNIVLEAQLVPRFLKFSDSVSARLSKFSGTRAVLFCDKEGRTQDVGSQIFCVERCWLEC